MNACRPFAPLRPTLRGVAYTLAALCLAHATGSRVANIALADTPPPLKVGFVYLGPVGDHGWTYGHEQARLAVEAHFGDRVETRAIENVAEGPDAERVFLSLADEGYNLIFANAFGHTRHALRATARNPELKIEVATGHQTGERVALFSARFYEARYAAGVIAGRMTQTDTIGYIASLPVPEVVRGINAFLLGMRSVNPHARIKVVWVHAWYDPVREGEAARVLLSQDADVLTQHTDSTAALQVAEAAGALAFGLASDMHSFAPRAHLTSIVNHWNDYYIERIELALAGTWESGTTWGGLASGMVSLSPYHNIPPATATEADAALAAVRDEGFAIFSGPLVDRDGKVRAKAGETLDDADLLSMDWFLEGVEGELP